MSFDASFETIVMDPGMEGGLKLTDDPADPGKLTFAGISSASWPGWSAGPSSNPPANRARSKAKASGACC